MKWLLGHPTRDDDFVRTKQIHLEAPPVWIEKGTSNKIKVSKKGTMRELLLAALTYPHRP